MSDYYFTWPDRGLTYDCRGCGACCRGLGIGVDAADGQLERLTRLYPELVPFVRRRGRAITVFNPRDRCWFLDDGGLCRVETEHGRDDKPASCRLFPFNRVFRIGNVTVVDFNSVICPLARADGDGISWAEITAEIETVRDSALIGTRLPGDSAFVAGERAIAELCWRADDWRDVWRAMGAGEAEPALAAAGAVLGVEAAAPAGRTLANALLLTPSMRFNELFGPRDYPAAGKLLAGIWLTWLVAAAAGERLAGRPLGLQELTTMWGEVAALGFACARWHHRPRLAPGPVELPGSDADPDGVVRALGEAAVGNKSATLGNLWRRACGERSPADAASLLKLAEPVLRKMTFRR